MQDEMDVPLRGFSNLLNICGYMLDGILIIKIINTLQSITWSLSGGDPFVVNQRLHTVALCVSWLYVFFVNF